MTRKADEPRALIKIPISLRNEIKARVKPTDGTILNYIVTAVKAYEHNVARTQPSTSASETTVAENPVGRKQHA